MTLEYVKKAIVEDCNEMYFTYEGKECGIDIEVHNSIYSFDMWFGGQLRTYNNFDEMVTDPFFGGKSIADLVKEGVEFGFY